MMSTSNNELNLDPRLNGRRVERLFRDADNVIIVAPFVTRTGLQPLLDILNPSARVTLYTRWLANEVAAGVSDPNIYLDIRALHGNVYLNHSLHAKAYIKPGDSALVGSANTTGKGLGWNGAGGIELLVDVADTHPALAALMNLLESTSASATEDILNDILVQAQEFDSSIPVREKPATQLSSWLPSYSAPWALWRVYSGDREESVNRLAAPDLAALDLPAGLNEKQFHAYVASILVQGLTGKMAEQLRNLSAYQSVQELKRLAENAGVTINDPEKTWQKLSAWLYYFLPDRYTLASGGRTLYS